MTTILASAAAALFAASLVILLALAVIAIRNYLHQRKERK